jgi:hypothetical protein
MPGRPDEIKREDRAGGTVAAVAAVDPIWGARGWMCARCRLLHVAPATCCSRPAVDLADPAARLEMSRRIWSYDPRSVWYALKRWRLRRALQRIWGKLRYHVGAPIGSYPTKYRPPSAPPLHGIARGAGAVPPFGGAPCVAYGLELHNHRHRVGRIMLRDAASAGFVIELDDGRTVRVPPGPISVAMTGAPVEPIATTAWRDLLAWTHVSAATEPRPIVPHDEVVARRIADGDPVALWAELGPDPTPSGYRDAAPLLARAPIWLRPVAARG